MASHRMSAAITRVPVDPQHTAYLADLAARLIVVAIAGATLATTGRLMRWLPETSPPRALAATTAISVLCLIGDDHHSGAVRDAHTVPSGHRHRRQPHPHRLQHRHCPPYRADATPVSACSTGLGQVGIAEQSRLTCDPPTAQPEQ
jgi:hypothetical protein